MRDKIKNQTYFNEFISEDTDRINKFVKKLANNEIKEERVLSIKIKIHDLRLGILIAKYSRGDNLEEIEKDYLKLIEDWEEVWQSDFYMKNLWMISLGVLLNLGMKQFEKIKELLDKYNVNDWLYNFLLRYNVDGIDEIQGDLSFPEVYVKLKEIICNQTNRSEMLKLYISNDWYHRHNECGWYDSHKSKQNLYYGYWSFEAGAIAKILDIPDKHLKDEQYYPYDLVHYTS
ncbi:uncharacterized protein DUF1910 [Mobilisporobacter senegalensis]|uniref:Uncharacterized protein DUF1910 n=1 Tax=Mobilisporobacter senegalensis TaxID=1329262 RepID=A0A3N1XYS3_9FIRM|nr:PoNi-like cognate immunity protein [Mobilisporobacter senegalensis]ROR31755.1 uncharacterized protein DUF1910 [Mobilisporobacter senegalensis]